MEAASEEKWRLGTVAKQTRPFILLKKWAGIAIFQQPMKLQQQVRDILPKERDRCVSGTPELL